MANGSDQDCGLHAIVDAGKLFHFSEREAKVLLQGSDVCCLESIEQLGLAAFVTALFTLENASVDDVRSVLTDNQVRSIMYHALADMYRMYFKVQQLEQDMPIPAPSSN